MSHRKLVADVASLTGKSEFGVFLAAIHESRGMLSLTLNEEAHGDYRRYISSSCVPLYVENYAITKLARKMAKKISRNNPSESLVDELT